MIIGTIIKQPRERLDYDVDCKPAFNNDDSDFITDAEVTVTPAGLTVTPVVVPDIDEVKLWIDGGVDETDYTIELLVTTDAGRKQEDEIFVKVEEFS